jgi:hypothetical protein
MPNPISIQVYTPPHSWARSNLGSEKSTVTSISTLGLSLSAFSYEELSVATNGFFGANFIGEGGFGYVHKGVLPNGKVVAIKQLKSGSAQGEREFRAEVEVIIVVSITGTLFHWLDTAFLGHRGCLFMSLSPTTPCIFIYMVRI